MAHDRVGVGPGSSPGRRHAGDVGGGAAHLVSAARQPRQRAVPAATGLKLFLELQLAREPGSVPLTRHLVGQALAQLGADVHRRAAVEAAVSEACSNAVRHADPADAYAVRLWIDRSECVVEVADGGAGFDHVSVPVYPPDSTAEAGRGLVIIAALVDRLEVVRGRPSGVVVRMTTRLAARPGQ